MITKESRKHNDQRTPTQNITTQFILALHFHINKVNFRHFELIKNNKQWHQTRSGIWRNQQINKRGVAFIWHLRRVVVTWNSVIKPHM